MWKLFVQIFFKLRIVITHAHCTHAALGYSYEQSAHRRVDDRVIDIHTASASTVGCGRHAEFLRSVFVKTTAGVEARLVKRIRHSFAFAYERLEVAKLARGQVLARADAHHSFERTLQMKNAHACVRRKLGQL